MFGKLNPDQIEEVLNREVIGRIGCHADGIPYVVPISYAYDGDYIYCHTFEGMKINIMRKCPFVCFEVDNTKNLANWQSVITWGRFEELPPGAERNEALKKLEGRTLPMLSSETMHLSPQWPFTSQETNNIEGIVFRIHLIEKTGRFEKSNGEYPFSA